MKILMVLTSHNQLGNTGLPTGFWLEEFAAPYFVFRDAGVELTLASPKGGQPPLDPKSDLPENQTPAMARFKKDAAAQKALANTVKLADMKAEDFDTVFYPGGHGPMWDLAESPASIALLEAFYNSGKPIALVCHSPGVLRHVTYQGAPLVKGKHVTGFTNGEEEAMQLTKVVPFLVEDELLRLGAIFEKKANWQPFSITDGRLITGQNPASSTSAAQALLKLMKESDSSIDSVQIEHKSYEMPPREGISIAHFLTVADIDRSARFYETVFGGRALSKGDSDGRACVHSDREYVAPGQRRRRADPGQADGNAQRPRPESHQQLYEYPRRGYSSLLQIMEKPGSRVHHGADPEVRRDALLHPRS